MIVNRKDFICGLLFVGIGLLFVVGSKGLYTGTATRMGPGYFPLVLAGMMIFLGALISLKSYRQPDAALGDVPWRAMLLIIPALIFFGFSVRGIGLVPAIFGVALAASFASQKMTPLLAISLAAGMSIFCSLVFVTGLGLPIELFGPWVRFW